MFNESTVVDWLDDRARYFSVRLNGYSHPPKGPYISTLTLIDRPGKIIDIGCGNGMLLQFLMTFSGHKLEPFGIDISDVPLEQAVTEVLPEYRKNFLLKNGMTYDFAQGPFDIMILGNPYGYGPVRKMTDTCLEHLNKGGRLIYRVHDDVLRSRRIKSVEEIPELMRPGARASRGVGLQFLVVDK